MAAKKRKKQAKTSARRPAAARKRAKHVAKPVARRPAKAAMSDKARLSRNKKIVLTMYQHLIGEKDLEKARRYMGQTYKQHAPYARDGHEGVGEWIKGFKDAFPNHRYEVKKVIAEGDFVVLHLHGMNGPNPHGESVVDIFRVIDGKVVEHWDVIQAIPDTADNANSMF